MRVSDVMSKQVDYVSANTSVKDVCRIIFGRSINGVPVCKNKKVVGFVTEHDILAKFYPSIQEYMYDPVHSSDFEGMEKKISEILALRAEKVMSKNPEKITPNTPLLRAQSLMATKGVGRLPVVDDKGHLVGIIAKGDIFKSLVGKSFLLEEEGGFYDWLAIRYDSLIDWKRRLSREVPELEELFKKERVEKVLDVASSTGEHSIALAKRNFEVFGIESSSLMDKLAVSKKNKLPENVQKNLRFFKGNYKEILKGLGTIIDAAIFMGNTLPHVLYTYKNILKDLASILRKDKAFMVFQIVNFQKALQSQQGLRDFTLKAASPGSYYKSNLFIGFYTKRKRDEIVYTRAIFSSSGEEKWTFIGVNSTPILDIRKAKLEKLLKSIGFLNVSFYGSSFYGSHFKDPFKQAESNWMNVVAKR